MRRSVEHWAVSLVTRLGERSQGSSHVHSQYTKAFSFSPLWIIHRGGTVCFVPFYYKIHKATLTTGLAKCGVAPPSQATPPSRTSVQCYTPIVCTVVELSTLPVKERTLWFCWTWEYHRSSSSLGSCCLESSVKYFTKVTTPCWINVGESKNSVALSEICSACTSNMSRTSGRWPGREKDMICPENLQLLPNILMSSSQGFPMTTTISQTQTEGWEGTRV